MYLRRGRFSFWAGRVASTTRPRWAAWLRIRDAAGAPRWFVRLGADVPLLLATEVALVLLALPSLAWAQASSAAPADAPISPGWDAALSIWQGLGATVVAGLGWLLTKGYGLFKAWIEAKTQNQLVLHALASGQRLQAFVHNAVLATNQVLVDDIRAAKRPDSPGGADITETEAAQIKAHAWEAVKAQAGGWSGLLAAFGHILGGEESVARKHVETLIEAEVGRLKAAAATPGPQAPAT